MTPYGRAIRCRESVSYLNAFKTEPLTLELGCSTLLQPVLDGQLQPFQFLNAKHIRPAPLKLSTKFTVDILVKLHQSK